MATTRRPARGAARHAHRTPQRGPLPAAAAPFARRRQSFMRALARTYGGSGGRGGTAGAPVAALFASGHEARRNGDVDYEFRQPSTFYYLTGFEEPDAVALLRPGHAQPYVLFVRPHDPQQAIWVGPRAGVEGAVDAYGADAAHPIEELDQRLPALLDGMRTVAFSLGADERLERIVSRTVAARRGAGQRGAVAIERVVDPFPLVAQQRLVKTRDEVAALRRAVAITGAGIEAAMRTTRPGMHEYELEATLHAEYRRLGAPRLGFPSIVASGANACTLHYTANSKRIADHDLVLLDTGAEWAYYGADVSRTYPASGRFTPEQRAVYDIVYEAQAEAISLVAPGVRIADVHARAVRVLVDGLRHMGVLSGRSAQLIRDTAYLPYFMHGTSHWLGLDVHDVGAYREEGQSVALRPGMVLTVEPGLYIGPATDAPRALRGIGVRIEDDILVTRAGHENLSQAIPRDPDTLEALVRG